MTRRDLWVSSLLLFVAYAALTVFFTYPLVRHFGTHHVGEAGGDAKIYLWNYWWVARALTEGVNPLATDAIFHPIGIGLAFHTLAPLQGVLFLLGRGVFGDVGAANAVVMWTFIASALAAYALAREVGSNRAGAFIAGMVFAFCPSRLARLAGHYDLLGTEWIPLFGLLLLKSKRRPWLAVAAGAAAAGAAYTAATYAVFLWLFTLLLLTYRRELWVLKSAAVSGLVAVVLMAPLIWQAAQDRSMWSYPPYPGTDRYAASLSDYFVRPGTAAAATAFDNATESTVFLGYTVVALGLIGVARLRSHPPLGFWLASSAVFFALSLGGPPFELLQSVPLLENLRAPGRLSILVMLSLAMVAALTVDKGLPFLRNGETGRRAIPLALTALLVVELSGVREVPLFPAAVPDIYHRLAEVSDGRTVVEVPGIEQSPGELMFHQTVHGHPVLIGTAARVPREKLDYYTGLPLVRPLIDLRKGRLELSDALVERERAAAPSVARFLGVGYFVLHRAYAKRGVIDFVEAVLPVARWHEDDERVVLEIKNDELPPDPSVIEAGSPQSRQHFESGWARPEGEDDFSFRWANRERSTLLFRRPPGVTSLVLEIAPLELDGQRTELRMGSTNEALAAGWQDLRIPLETRDGAREVERLTLQWSQLGTPSAEDPRRLAARVRRLRLE